MLLCRASRTFCDPEVGQSTGLLPYDLLEACPADMQAIVPLHLFRRRGIFRVVLNISTIRKSSHCGCSILFHIGTFHNAMTSDALALTTLVQDIPARELSATAYLSVIIDTAYI
jgi:hypothetical protein